MYWVLNPSGVELVAFMYKQSGMLYVFDDIEFQNWTSAFDGATIT